MPFSLCSREFYFLHVRLFVNLLHRLLLNGQISALTLSNWFIVGINLGQLIAE